MTRKRKRGGKRGPTRLSKAQLDHLSEQATGLYTMIEDNLALPFGTTVLGVPVTVERVRLTRREEIVAVCRRASVRQTVPLLDVKKGTLTTTT